MHTLTKADGQIGIDGLERMAVGVSWTPSAGATKGIFGAVKRKKGVDLDGLAVLKSHGDPVRFAGWDQLDPLSNQAVTHSGDNLTGEGDGDDETLTVNFPKLAQTPVDEIIFFGSAFKRGTKLNQAAQVSFKVYTQGIGETALEQVADIWPSLLVHGNTIAVAKVKLTGGFWNLEVLNQALTVKQGDFESLLKASVDL